MQFGRTESELDILQKLRTPDPNVWSEDGGYQLALMGERTVPFLVQTLTDEDQYARQHAYTFLYRYYGDSRALPALTELFLHNEDDSIRRNAATLIAGIDAKYATELMMEHFNADEVTQDIVVDVLLMLKDERVVPVLVARLENPKTRTDAAFALSKFKDKRAVPVLLDILELEDGKIDNRSKKDVVEKLAYIGDERAVPALLELLDTNLEADVVHLLPQFGTSIILPLQKMLEQLDDQQIARHILHDVHANRPRVLMAKKEIVRQILRDIRDPKLAPIYGKIYLKSDDTELQSALLLSLMNMGTEGFSTLLDILRHKPNASVLNCLTTFNSAAAVDAVASFAQDESCSFRLEAIQGLAKFGGLQQTEISKHLPRLLTDADSTVKLYTIDLIRKMALTEMSPALQELTQDDDECIRNAALTVLAIFAGNAPLKFKIETNQSRYKYGQSIELTYRIMNTGSQPIEYLIPSIHLIETLKIRQPDGTLAKYRGWHVDFAPLSSREHYQALQPGDESAYTLSIPSAYTLSIPQENNIDDNVPTYWLHQSGRYTVQLDIAPAGNGLKYGFMAWQDTLTSKVDFEIEPPTTEQFNKLVAKINPERISELNRSEISKICHQLSELQNADAILALKKLATVRIDNTESTLSAAKFEARRLLSKFSDPELVPICIEMLDLRYRETATRINALGESGDTRAH